jgi:hypothetical protein
MSDTLFEGYGEPTPPRTIRSSEHPQARVAGEWRLFASRLTRPLAHLIDFGVPATALGAYGARCGYVARIIHVDGAPLAPVCIACHRIHEGPPT